MPLGLQTSNKFLEVHCDLCSLRELGFKSKDAIPSLHLHSNSFGTMRPTSRLRDTDVISSLHPGY